MIELDNDKKRGDSYISSSKEIYNENMKNGNSLETQFWNDEVEIDPNSPLTKLIDKVWISKEDYIPTVEEIEQFNKGMKEYHKNKKCIQK